MFTNTTEVYDEIITYLPLFVGLITAGILMRTIYCFVRMMGADENEQPMYRKRIKNGIVFFAIAMSVLGIASLAMGYANP